MFLSFYLSPTTSPLYSIIVLLILFPYNVHLKGLCLTFPPGTVSLRLSLIDWFHSLSVLRVTEGSVLFLTLSCPTAILFQALQLKALLTVRTKRKWVWFMEVTLLPISFLVSNTSLLSPPITGVLLRAWVWLMDLTRPH